MIFDEAQLGLLFSSLPMLVTQPKYELLGFVTFTCQEFGCSFTYNFMGRTTRKVNQWASKHLTSWLKESKTKIIYCSVLPHLVDSGHVLDRNKLFRVIYRTPTIFLYIIWSRILYSASAVAIQAKQYGNTLISFSSQLNLANDFTDCDFPYPLFIYRNYPHFSNIFFTFYTWILLIR